MPRNASFSVSYSRTRYVSFESVSRNRLHRHSFYEPCIVISGNGEFEHDSRVFALNEGDLFVANPGTFHEIRSLDSRDLKLYFTMLTITRARGSAKTSRSRQLNQGDLLQFLLNHRVHLPGQSHLIPLFEHAMKLARQGADFQENRYYHQASSLLVQQIVSALASPEALSEEGIVERFHANRVVELIENRLHQPLRIADLAGACGMSERTLRRKWSEVSQRTLTEEINHRRIERACQLLLLPDITIAGVGYQVGIPSPARFSRLFKETMNMTPRAYRQHALDKLSPGQFSGGPLFQTEFVDGAIRDHSS